MKSFTELDKKKSEKTRKKRAELTTVIEANEDAYFPEYLDSSQAEEARDIVKTFTTLAKDDEIDTTFDLFSAIQSRHTGDERKQLLRVFRRYACVDLPHEMVKKKNFMGIVENSYTDYLRDIGEIREVVQERPDEDETMIALLQQHQDGSLKGYDLEERIAKKLKKKVPELEIEGEGAGDDVPIEDWISDYEKTTPADMVGLVDGEIRLVVFASYRRGRGGSQSGDRGGSNANYAQDLDEFAEQHERDIKTLIVTDGPGVVFDDVWNNHAKAEEQTQRARVCTLKMMEERVTRDWILGTEGK